MNCNFPKQFHKFRVSGNPLRSIPETTVNYFFGIMKGALYINQNIFYYGELGCIFYLIIGDTHVG